MNNSPHPHLTISQHISTHLASSCCSALVPRAAAAAISVSVMPGRGGTCPAVRAAPPLRAETTSAEVSTSTIYTVYISTLSRYPHIYVPSRVCTNTNTCVIVNRNMTIILKLNLNCVLEFKLIKILSPSDVTRANCMRLFKCSR